MWKPLFFLSVCFLSFSSSQIVEYLKAGHKCQKELGIEKRTADRIVKGNPVEPNEENQCYVKCLYQTFGIIDAEGDFLPDVARLKVPKPLGRFKDLANDWVDECQYEDGEDMCEKAYNIWHCFVRLKTKNQQEIIKKLSNSHLLPTK